MIRKQRSTVGALLGAGVALWCVLAMTACQPQPIPDGGNNCTGFCGDFTFTGGTPIPTGSPSPGTGTITRVAISSFGEEGPNPPIPDTATVRLGNRERITCTPKMTGPSGNEIDAPPSVHGSAPDVFALTSGSGTIATFDQDDGEPFNGSLKGIAAGTATLKCSVKGVSAEKVYTVQR